MTDNLIRGSKGSGVVLYWHGTKAVLTDNVIEFIHNKSQIQNW
jgi:hypothetical protein